MTDVLDLSEPKDVKTRNERVKREITSRATVLNAVLQHREGRKFVYWLLEISHVNENAFQSNALAMAHKTGAQNVGQQLLAELTIPENIDLYFQMLKEARNG